MCADDGYACDETELALDATSGRRIGRFENCKSCFLQSDLPELTPSTSAGRPSNFGESSVAVTDKGWTSFEPSTLPQQVRH